MVARGSFLSDLPAVVPGLERRRRRRPPRHHAAARPSERHVVARVDAIWLSPFYRSPMADFGYDVSDYRDVDPDLRDARRLRPPARRGASPRDPRHGRSGAEPHLRPAPWFSAARSSRGDPKRDWYVWADPAATVPRTTGARCSVGTGAGRSTPRSGQYYLHHFLPEQPDLNWWNEDVRAAIDDVMRFWLDRGIDGFRIDVAHSLVKDKLLRNNPRLFAKRRPRYNWEHDEVHEIIRRWRRLLDEYRRPRGDRRGVDTSGSRISSATTATTTSCTCRSTSTSCGSRGAPSGSARIVEEWERLLPPRRVAGLHALQSRPLARGDPATDRAMRASRR